MAADVLIQNHRIRFGIELNVGVEAISSQQQNLSVLKLHVSIYLNLL
jgi:hypothetical protein